MFQIDMTGRRWRVGEDVGDTFDEDEDFSGITLTIEIRDAAEAREVVGALLAARAETEAA